MIVGTAGHVDHGKTALVRALTGVDTDRLQEEKARGMTIDLGFAYLAMESGSTIGFVDVPGHERFVHTMLAGASGIDFLLLVVAVDDGVMPQTREHLAIADLLGIRRGLVVLSKCDLADAARRAEVAREIRAALVPTAFADADLIPVSTLTGEGIYGLRDRLRAEAASPGRHAAQGRFRLAVDRSFILRGVGTVATGTVLSGAADIGESVVISPSGRPARIRSIHAQGNPADRAQAGDRCALNLAGEGIGKEAIRRGDMLLDPALHAPTDRIDATLRVLPAEAKSIGQWFPARLHHAAAEVGARIVLLGDDPIHPGETARVQLVLEGPIASAAGDAYVLRDTSGQRTIGGGRFLDLRAPARRRRTADRLAALDAHAIADDETALSALLDRPPFHLDLVAFARDRVLGGAETERLVAALALARFPVASAVFVMKWTRWLAFRHGIAETLEKFHADNPDLPGIGMERLRLQLEPRLPAPLFAAILRDLSRAGALSLDGAWVRLRGHEARFSPSDETLWQAVHPLIGGDAGFHPPRVRDIADLVGRPEAEIRRLLKLAGRMARVHEVAHDHFFLRSELSRIVDIAGELAGSAPDGQFTAAQFRDRVGSGRKVAIHLLEFLDRHGVTFRRGDLRRINHRRLDLFRQEEAAEISGGTSSPAGRPDFKSERGDLPQLHSAPRHP